MFNDIYCLVVSNMLYFPQIYIYGIILPIDELIFFKIVIASPTSLPWQFAITWHLLPCRGQAGFDSLVTAQLYAYLREISPAQVKEAMGSCQRQLGWAEVFQDGLGSENVDFSMGIVYEKWRIFPWGFPDFVDFMGFPWIYGSDFFFGFGWWFNSWFTAEMFEAGWFFTLGLSLGRQGANRLFLYKRRLECVWIDTVFVKFSHNYKVVPHS